MGISLTIQCLDIDAADPQALASFWEVAQGGAAPTTPRPGWPSIRAARAP